MSAPTSQEEKKSPEVEEPSELATVLQSSLDSLNAVGQLTGLITTLKDNLASAQQIEQTLTKDTATLQTELSKFKTKFGALKWSQVKAQGYPKARRDCNVIDTYTNAAGDEVKVNDPYRWLEDPDSTHTREWVEEQVDTTTAYLYESGDTVSTIYKTLEENLDFPRYGKPSRRGKDPIIYYYTHNSGLQNQSVLYYHEGSLDAPRQCLLDPNTLSEDGTTSSKGYYFSENGKYLCYGISKAGSDWVEFHVKEVLTGKELDDVLMWCKFTGICWTHDNLGFFYSRYDKPQRSEDDEKKSKGKETEKLSNQQLFYHTLGTKQEDDIFLVDGITLGDAEWMVGAGMSWDGKWLELYITPSCDPVNRLYLVDITDSKAYSQTDVFQNSMIKLIDNFDFGYEAINNEGTLFYFKTNESAGNYRVVSCDIMGDVYANGITWSEIVAESKYRLEDASVVGKDKILLTYNEDVKSVIKLIDLKGNTAKHSIIFPAAGSISSKGSKKHNEGFFYFTSFLYPGSIYTYDFDRNKLKLWKEITVNGFNSDDYETKQVFYDSKDGTKIPMYILSAKGLELNGQNPTIMYGYGGFDISLNPSFQASKVLWLKHARGVYCVANLRGGGEYGEKWHKAGTKANKQNVFDDFHAAAEYLIDAKYTNARKLAIEGGSNGGLLVSACCNQRPDLYECGVAHCGVLDMLRFNKFTIGYAWCSDYGSPDKKEEFDALYKYSPLINVPDLKDKEAQYPCYMATTADHDDRVSPLHSFKFVAELQHRLGGNVRQTNPLLIRIEVKSGHGSSSLKKGIELRADTFAFMLKCLGGEWK